MLRFAAQGLLAITATLLIAGVAGLGWLNHRGEKLLSVQAAGAVPAARPGDAILVRPSGQAAAVAPGLGRVLDVLSRPAVLVLAIHLPAGCIIAAEARRLVNIYARPFYSARL